MRGILNRLWRLLGTAISFPGEIRFDEDRTAHVVPRVPGVVEAVHAELPEQSNTPSQTLH